MNEQKNPVSLPSYPIKLLAVPAVVLLVQLAVQISSEPSFLNHDCAFLLHGARLLMDGKRPLVDFVDMVQPLAFYLLIPVWTVSRAVSIPIELTWSILCWISVLVIFILGVVTVRNSANMRVRDWLCIGPFFCGFLLFNLVVMYHFGQREHLFVLAFWLFLLLRWQRSLGNEAGKLIAVVAGVTCAIICFVKPHFFLIIAFLEIYWWLLATIQFNPERYKLRRAPEVVAGVLTYMICVLVSLLIPNLGSYYGRWLPIVSQGYAVFNATPPSLLLFATDHGQLFGNRFLVGAILLAAVFMIRKSSLLLPLLIWTVGGWIVYVVQGKGWAYHTIPMVAGYFLVASVVIGLLAVEVLQLASKRVERAASLNPDLLSGETSDGALGTKGASRCAVVAFLVFGTLLIPTSGSLIHNSVSSGKVFATLDNVVENNSGVGSPVMIVTTNFVAAYPLVVRLDRRQATRYMWCFSFPMIDYLKQVAGLEKWRVQESLFAAEVAEDIKKTSPQVIAIEAGGPWRLHEALFENTTFERTLTAKYEPLGVTNGFAVWRAVK